MAGERASRDEGRRRVERWKDSGLTAKEFAAETGINAGTLQFWRYKLRKLGPGRRGRARATASILSSIVEVQAAVVAAESRFEIEVGNGRRLLPVRTGYGEATRISVSIEPPRKGLDPRPRRSGCQDELRRGHTFRQPLLLRALKPEL
jgi:transposase-like protein